MGGRSIDNLQIDNVLAQKCWQRWIFSSKLWMRKLIVFLSREKKLTNIYNFTVHIIVPDLFFNPLLRGPWVSYSIWYSIPCRLKKMYLKTHKSIIVSWQYFGLGIQIVLLFLYIGTLGEKAIESCEYHIVPRPCKWGRPVLRILLTD